MAIIRMKKMIRGERQGISGFSWICHLKPGPYQDSVRLHLFDKYQVTTQAVKEIAP